jgi:hypothetical protein
MLIYFISGDEFGASFFIILSLLWKNTSRLIRSPCCLCVCGSLQSSFECLNQSLWNLVYISWNLSPSQRHIL